MTNHNQNPEETKAAAGPVSEYAPVSESSVSEPPVSEPPVSEPPVSEQRRTLIKASASAPLAATLFSGSALATSSLTCIGGDFSNKKFKKNGNSLNGDSAVRVKVCYYERTHLGAMTCSWLHKECPKKVYIIHDEQYTQNGDVVHVPSWIIDSPLKYTKCYAYVLVLYSFDDGCVEELGPWPKIQLVEDGGHGTPITGSCLASIVVSDSCKII